MTRGSVVVIGARGPDTGKPRPAVIVQANLFNETHSSITVCPVTSECVDAPIFRVTLPPGDRTGLTTVSQVMIDKVVSVPRASVVKEIGRCHPGQLEEIGEALRRWLDL